MTLLRRLAWFALALGAGASRGAGAPGLEGPMALAEAKTWMYQSQDVEKRGAVEALARSGYDLLVVEPVGTYRLGRSFDVRGMVDRLHSGRAGRIVLAYLSLGEADENRAYWGKDWRPSDKDRRGMPDFVLKPDPEGWKETHVVQFGDARWQALVVADVRTVMAAGFDGLWLDGVEYYEDPAVAGGLRAQGRHPAREIVDLVVQVRAEARKANPKAEVVIQNAPFLLEDDPRIGASVDGLGAEATWYRGTAEAGWSDAQGGDRPNAAPGRASAAARVAQYAKWKAAGKPVFTLDYCLSADHAKEVYDRALGLGLVPLVSRSALDRLTETPPPGLK